MSLKDAGVVHLGGGVSTFLPANYSNVWSSHVQSGSIGVQSKSFDGPVQSIAASMIFVIKPTSAILQGRPPWRDLRADLSASTHGFHMTIHSDNTRLLAICQRTGTKSGSSRRRKSRTLIELKKAHRHTSSQMVRQLHASQPPCKSGLLQL